MFVVAHVCKLHRLSSACVHDHGMVYAPRLALDEREVGPCVSRNFERTVRDVRRPTPTENRISRRARRATRHRAAPVRLRDGPEEEERIVTIRVVVRLQHAGHTLVEEVLATRTLAHMRACA